MKSGIYSYNALSFCIVAPNNPPISKITFHSRQLFHSNIRQFVTCPPSVAQSNDAVLQQWAAYLEKVQRAMLYDD
jgi:hypothetical protein